jgi:hypothetical protein
MQKTCKVCGCEIPAERLEVLPDTETCTQHSGVRPMVGFMVSEFSKATAPVLVQVDPNNREALRRAKRAFHRAR